jgi:DNA-binding beta-propeller fold protein YncE
VPAAVLVSAAVVAGVFMVLDEDQPSIRAATPTPPPTATATASPSPSPQPTPDGMARAVETIEGIGNRPAGIAFAGGDMWVMSPRSGYLTRIDAETNRERKRHPKVGHDTTAIVGDGDTVFLTIGMERLLIALDAMTGKERWRAQVPAGPRRLAVDERGVWVGTNSEVGEPGFVVRYDRETGLEEQRVLVAEGVGAMASSGDALWIVKRDTNSITRLDPGEAQFRDIVNAPGPVRSMSFGAGCLWLVLAGEDTIARYAMDGREPLTAAAGRNPTTAVVAGGHLYVASRNDQSVLVFDPERLVQVQDPIPVGINPIALAASDDEGVWVTSLGDNTVTRIEQR